MAQPSPSPSLEQVARQAAAALNVTLPGPSTGNASDRGAAQPQTSSAGATSTSTNPALQGIVDTASKAIAASNGDVTAAIAHIAADLHLPVRKNSYLIGIKASCSAAQADMSVMKPALAKMGVQVDWGYNVKGVRGMKVTYTGPALPLTLLSGIPCVDYIEDDVVIQTAGSDSHNSCLQTPAMSGKQPLWGLDAMDGSYDGAYSYDLTGDAVNVYVVDSGISFQHPEFEGRAANVWISSSLQSDTTAATSPDCTGHGTHVAGIIGGKTVGVAKKVKLNGMRMIGCDKTGSVSDAVEALNYIALNMKKPAVINMSLGSTEILRGQTLPNAIAAVAKAGAAVVIAAGNSNVDVCDTSSPSMTTVPNTFVVGALTASGASSVFLGSYDPTRASFSNYGKCVNYWAPGDNIWSASNNSISTDKDANAFEQRRGTSQAAPFVAGVLALYLQNEPTLTPAQLAQRIKDNSKPITAVSPTAMHVQAPRLTQLTESQQAMLAAIPKPTYAQCSISTGGVVAGLSAATGVPQNMIIVGLAIGGAALLLIAGVVTLRVRSARRARDAKSTADSQVLSRSPLVATGGAAAAGAAAALSSPSPVASSPTSPSSPPPLTANPDRMSPRMAAAPNPSAPGMFHRPAHHQQYQDQQQPESPYDRDMPSPPSLHQRPAFAPFGAAATGGPGGSAYPIAHPEPYRSSQSDVGFSSGGGGGGGGGRFAAGPPGPSSRSDLGFSPSTRPQFGGGDFRPQYGGEDRPQYGGDARPQYGGDARPQYGGDVRPQYGGFAPPQQQQQWGGGPPQQQQFGPGPGGYQQGPPQQQHMYGGPGGQQADRSSPPQGRYGGF